ALSVCISYMTEPFGRQSSLAISPPVADPMPSRYFRTSVSSKASFSPASLKLEGTFGTNFSARGEGCSGTPTVGSNRLTSLGGGLATAVDDVRGSGRLGRMVGSRSVQREAADPRRRSFDIIGP